MNKVTLSKQNAKQWIVFGAIICALYVVLGAFGSHGLEGKLTTKQLNTYETGLRYMIIHGIGLITTNLSYTVFDKFNVWPNRFALAGLLLFSVSLVIHATKDLLGINLNVFALLAPLGGISYILFWTFFAITISKK